MRAGRRVLRLYFGSCEESWLSSGSDGLLVVWARWHWDEGAGSGSRQRLRLVTMWSCGEMVGGARGRLEVGCLGVGRGCADSYCAAMRDGVCCKCGLVEVSDFAQFAPLLAFIRSAHAPKDTLSASAERLSASARVGGGGLRALATCWSPGVGEPSDWRDWACILGWEDGSGVERKGHLGCGIGWMLRGTDFGGG